MRRFRILRTLAVTGALACIAAPLAQAHRRHDAATFSDGSCQFTGTVYFAPPLTNTPQATRDFAYETGTCSGTLTAHGRTSSVSDQPARYFATDAGQAGSCGANPEATGSGYLAFRGARISFALSESRVTGVSHLSLTGDAGGSAQGVATISSSSNPLQIVEACLGAGLRSTPVDISLQTTPAISG
jgi:hypothetical protein